VLGGDALAGTVPSGAVPPTPLISLIELTGTGVQIETVKLADDRSGDVVLRVYEGLGARSRGRLTPQFAVTDVSEVDLLEEPLPDDIRRARALAFTDGAVDLELAPFQVVTLRLRRHA